MRDVQAEFGSGITWSGGARMPVRREGKAVGPKELVKKSFEELVKERGRTSS